MDFQICITAGDVKMMIFIEGNIRGMIQNNPAFSHYWFSLTVSCDNGLWAFAEGCLLALTIYINERTASSCLITFIDCDIIYITGLTLFCSVLST